MQSTLNYMETMRKAGFDIPLIDKSLLHMVSTGFFSSVFQIIEHDMDMETAKKNISQLKDFQTGGWEKLLGIKFPQQPS